MIALVPLQRDPGMPAPHHFTAISISAALVALAFALLLKWRPLRRLEPLVPWLCLVAGIGFSAAFLGGLVQQLSDAARQIPWVGSALPVIVAGFLLFVLCYDLWPHHPTNTLTAISSLLLPSAAPAIGGVVGSTLGTALSWIAVAGAAFISTTVGV